MSWRGQKEFAKSLYEIFQTEQITNFSIRFFHRGMCRGARIILPLEDKAKVMKLMLTEASGKCRYLNVFRIHVQEGPGDLLVVITSIY